MLQNGNLKNPTYTAYYVAVIEMSHLPLLFLTMILGRSKVWRVRAFFMSQYQITADTSNPY